jgi:hypothetical protein
VEQLRRLERPGFVNIQGGRILDSRLQPRPDRLMQLNSQRSHSRGEYYRSVCEEMGSNGDGAGDEV